MKTTTDEDRQQPPPEGHTSWDAFIDATWLSLERAAAQGDSLAAYYRDLIAELTAQLRVAREAERRRGTTDD